jgi:hypothetical protein
MKKSHSIISVLIIGIFLFNCSLVVAQDTSNVDSGFNVLNWVNNQLGNAQFSVVGDSRQCSTQPSTELSIAYHGTIPAYTSYCSNALTDVFDTKWNALGEYKNNPQLICGDSDGCIIQYYCCPHSECTSNSDCVSWYGTGSQCLSKSSSDPGIAYQDGSTFKYCSSPSQVQVTCYYLSGTSCLDRTYIGQTSCPATYNGMTLYSTQSACTSSINTCIDTCSSLGYTSGTYTICGISTNCGTTSGTCDDYSHATKAICEARGCTWKGGLFNPTCGESASINTTTNTKVQIAISADSIQGMTATDLIKSACTTTDQCQEGGTCKTINSLVSDGYLTQSEAEAKIKLGKTVMLTAGGAAVGFGACAVVAGAVGVATAGTGALILFPICAIAGAGAGTMFDAVVGGISSGKGDKYGYCVLDSSSSLNKYFGWASLIPITKDKGVNGLLNILIFLVAIGFFLKK